MPTWLAPASDPWATGYTVTAADYNGRLRDRFDVLGGADGNTHTGPIGITGVTGAASPFRLGGATASGPPASGTWATGDITADALGNWYLCTAGGSPGTWVTMGSVVKVGEHLLASDGASLDVSNIPGTWRHLEVVIYARTSDGSTQYLGLRFNNDSGANYDGNYHDANNTTNVAGLFTGATSLKLGFVPASVGTALKFGMVHATVPMYANTTNHKAVGYFHHSTSTEAGNSDSQQGGGNWRSASAVTRVTIVSQGGGNLKAGSMLSVYARA